METILRGDCTVQNCNEVRESLLESLKKEGDLSLELDLVEKVDMSFLQLLAALERSCAQAGRKLAVRSKLKGEPGRLAHISGFSRYAESETANEQMCKAPAGRE